MLNDSSYHIAVYIYVGSACIMLLYLAWWLSRHWRAGFVALVVLPLAALLLTPAYPKAGVETMAPALIVAVFQFATQGPDAAAHAIRPLVFMSGVAVVIAVLLVAISFLQRRSTKPPKPTNPKRDNQVQRKKGQRDPIRLEQALHEQVQPDASTVLISQRPDGNLSGFEQVSEY